LCTSQAIKEKGGPSGTAETQHNNRDGAGNQAGEEGVGGFGEPILIDFMKFG